jgi:hypothetical protein
MAITSPLFLLVLLSVTKIDRSQGRKGFEFFHFHLATGCYDWPVPWWSSDLILLGRRKPPRTESRTASSIESLRIVPLSSDMVPRPRSEKPDLLDHCDFGP